MEEEQEQEGDNFFVDLEENLAENETVSEKDPQLPLKSFIAIKKFFSPSNENWNKVEKPKMYKR